MELWAIGVYDFGLTDEQFWALTPGQFAALAERHDESLRLADMGPARICAIIAEFHRDPEKRPEPFTYKDFMLRYGDEPGDDLDADMDPEAMKAGLMAIFPPDRPKPEPEEHG